MKKFLFIFVLFISFTEIVNGRDLGSKKALISDNEGHSNQLESISIEYNSYLASTGWIALYDTRRKKRCYMSKIDYYTIRERRKFINGYDYLIPLGMVIKYNGAKIIWGFEGVKGANWNDAKEYVENYSPDGHKWRLLSKIEALAIKTQAYNFRKLIRGYYPQDFSCFGAICNWTSTLSDETYKGANLVYTFVMYSSSNSAIVEKGRTTLERDAFDVYPISTL